MHYFIMKILNKRELKQITFNHWWDTDFKDFINLYIKYANKPCSFLVTDTNFELDFRFRKNLLEGV